MSVLYSIYKRTTIKRTHALYQHEYESLTQNEFSVVVKLVELVHLEIPGYSKTLTKSGQNCRAVQAQGMNIENTFILLQHQQQYFNEFPSHKLFHLSLR